MRSRARFIPARDSAGNPTTDSHVGRIIWKIERPHLQPFAPMTMVEEMRSDAAGALSCSSSFNAAPPQPKPCKAEQTGAQLAALARRNACRWLCRPSWRSPRKAQPRRPIPSARGDLFRSSDAILTVGADGSILNAG